MKKITFTLLFSTLMAMLSAQNWTPMADGLLPNNVVIFSISAVGDQVVWAVASGEYYQAPIPPSHRPHILRSSDGGQTWTLKEIEEAAGAISFQIVAQDSLTAWITTQDYSSGPGRILYQTTDGGEVWVKKLTNVSTGVALNLFPDGQHWLAHNRQAISRSADGGATWTNSSITGYQSSEFQILNSGTNMSSTVGDTLWNGTSAGRIVRFTNFGESSTFLNTGFGAQSSITSLAFHDHLNGLLYHGGKIAKTTNGGSNWADLSQQPPINGWNITTIPGSPGYYALATNYNSALGKIAITKDFGATWSVDNIDKSLNSIVFTSATSGWAGGGRLTSASAPALFKYTGSPLVAASVPAARLSGLTLSPNPAMDLIRFDFESDAENGSILVTLCDVAGRLVFQGEVFDRQLDVSRLPSGIYMLKIETDEGWVVRKIVRE